MIIDQNALDNLNFSHYKDKNSLNENKILTLINKYELSSKDNIFINSLESNYVVLTKYITDLYYLNKEIPQDIQDILKFDIEFKIYLVDDIQRRLEELVSNSSTLFFKEISNIINLLSLGNSHNIFNSYTKYNFDELSKLFRNYELFLKESESNSELFELIFDCYIVLIETITQLCIINSTDIQRKKTIKLIIELLTESNNLLKFSITLTEKKLDKLNNILGKLLYYFSHISYYEVDDKTMVYLIEEFSLNIQRQTDGYILSKDTNFGNNPECKKSEYIKYKNNNSFLILTLLKKLEDNFLNEDFFQNKNFQQIVLNYNNEFSLLTNQKNKEGLEKFRNKLLDSLIFNYQTYDKNKLYNLNHQEIIEDFILYGEDFKANNLEIIHNILLFSKNIEEYKYLQIISILRSTKIIKNDYYEFFRIKILDVIINKFTKKPQNSNFNEFLQKIIIYTEKNKIASQLLGIYTKIYLSLALYYSQISTENSIINAKNFYISFINSNGFDSLKNEYEEINNTILTNLGIFYCKELNIKNQNDINLKTLGSNKIESFLKYKELALKYEINQEIVNITNQILNNDHLDSEYINNKLSNIISNKLFFGITNVNINGLTKNMSKINNIGYKKHIMPLVDKFELLFIFPAIYEESFKLILNKNREYIKQYVTNILSGYSSNSNFFIDEVTLLDNRNKLKIDIEQNYGNITFIEIAIPSLIMINKKYGYDAGNRIFRAISQKIASFIEEEDKIYRLLGAHIGIVLKKQNTYHNLIQKILDFNIALKGETIDTKYTLAVTSATKENILILSEQNIEEAIALKKSINIKI